MFVIVAISMPRMVGLMNVIYNRDDIIPCEKSLQRFPLYIRNDRLRNIEKPMDSRYAVDSPKGGISIIPTIRPINNLKRKVKTANTTINAMSLLFCTDHFPPLNTGNH